MINKKILVAIILIAALLVNGCAISSYLTGKPAEKPYSLLTEEDLNEELENLTEEIEEIEIEDEEEQIKIEPVKEELEIPENAIKISVKENEAVNLKPKAVDPNADKIKFTYTEPLDEKGYWKTNYGDAGEYLITVTATDGELTTAKQVLLAVERVNMPPVIEDIDDIEIDEGSTLILTPKATDPNNDDVTITISEPIGDEGIWEISYKDAGKYTIVISATDGELTTKKEVKVTVNKKNVPPEIEFIDNIEINEGETVIIEPVVTDMNEDDLIIKISDPVGNNGTWETDYTDRGVYNITVSAFDGTTTTEINFAITVNAVNKAPEIIDIVQQGSTAGEETDEETGEEASEEEE